MVLLVSLRSLTLFRSGLISFLVKFTLTPPNSPDSSSTTFTDTTIYTDLKLHAATQNSLRHFGKYFLNRCKQNETSQGRTTHKVIDYPTVLTA
jgi:hypothetical protein